jgi:acyl carrier protein
VETVIEFVTLLHDEVGLSVSAEDLNAQLDDVAGWDSVLLLYLLTALERRTGRRLPAAEMFEAATLNDIYDLAVRA